MDLKLNRLLTLAEARSRRSNMFYKKIFSKLDRRSPVSKFLFNKVVCLQSTISVHCFSRTSSGHCFCKFSEFRNMKSNPLDWLKTQSQSIFLSSIYVLKRDQKILYAATWLIFTDSYFQDQSIDVLNVFS